MENIREFMDELSGEIVRMLPEDLTKDLSIDPVTVTKMNDQVLYGLSFKHQEGGAAPTIYVNEEYESHRKGKPLETISSQIVVLYMDTMLVRGETVLRDLSLDNDNNELTIRIVELKRNRNYLSEIPYASIGNGLAAVCDVKAKESDEGYWRTTITRKGMEENCYDKEKIFARAFENAPKTDPPTLITMECQMFGIDGTDYLKAGPISDRDKVPMYVLSNESGLLGAAALFYPGVQEKIAENLGENYYALPSSVHEFIIVPESLAPDPIHLAEMVRTANKTVVDPSEVLSDNVLFYDREEKQLGTAVQTITLSEKHQEARC